MPNKRGMELLEGVRGKNERILEKSSSRKINGAELTGWRLWRLSRANVDGCAETKEKRW
jgi:hypothetical protein